MKYRSRTIPLVLSLSLTAVLLLGTAVPQPAGMVMDIPEQQDPGLSSLDDSPPPLPNDGKEKADSLDSGVDVPRQQSDPKRNEYTIPKIGFPIEEVSRIVSPVDLSGQSSLIQSAAAPDGWTTIMSEDFEGAFPGAGWNVFDSDGATNGEYFWDDVSYRFHNGGWSAWPADGGADGITPPANYPNNMDSWMVYGPFDLSDAVDVEMLFSYWLSCEADYDWFFYGVSDDGTNFTGVFYDGSTGGWVSSTIYFPGWLGDGSVWFAFVFSSDASNTDEGVYVDDILLRKNTSDSNLAPYAPGGWDQPLVPASITGTHTVNNLYTYQNTYVDWTVINWGPDDILTQFDTCLYLDDVEINCWYTNGKIAGNIAFVEDWVLNMTPTPGWHNLKIVTDVNDDVAESNETDNTWSMDFYWHPDGNLTPYKPGSWTNPIVPSTLTGTNTVNDLYVHLDTYIDGAVVNSGTEDILAQFQTCLYFDSVEVYCWQINGLTWGNSDFIEDWVLNLVPAPGWHNLKIVTDAYGDVNETNETDNTWSADFYWNPSLNADIYITPSSLTSQQTQDQVMTLNLEIRNYGNASLDWSIYEAPTGSCSAADIPWVSISPDSGTTAIASTTPIDVVFDSTGLAAGTYNGVLCFSSNDPDKPLISLPITLETIEELTIFLPLLMRP